MTFPQRKKKQSASVRRKRNMNSLGVAILERFKDDALAQFNSHGFCVLKSALSDEAAGRFQEEIAAGFASNKLFSQNKVEFLLASGPIQLVKENVFECDLHNSTTRELLAASSRKGNHGSSSSSSVFASLFEGGHGEELACIFNERAPYLDLASAPGAAMAKHMTVKLQVNTGGSFPWHVDNPAPPNKRRLTMAVYLTRNWSPSVGGELVVQPFLGAATVIPPAFNTIVLFRADVMNHRTLPVFSGSNVHRHCFTIWFDSPSANKDEEVNLRAKHLSPEFIPELRDKVSPLHRSLTRAVYDEEYREAIVHCFGAESKQAVIAIKMHEAHLANLLKSEAVAKFVALLRAEKKSGMMADLLRK